MRRSTEFVTLCAVPVMKCLVIVFAPNERRMVLLSRNLWPVLDGHTCAELICGRAQIDAPAGSCAISHNALTSGAVIAGMISMTDSAAAAVPSLPPPPTLSVAPSKLI